MRTTLTITLLLALAAPAAAQDDRHAVRSVVRTVVAERTARAHVEPQRGDANTQTERITRTLKVGSSGDLDVANIAGDITITRGGGNDVNIEIIKTARGRSDDEAREMLQLVEIDIVERANRAEVRTRYPGREQMRRDRRNFNVHVVYNITAPAGTRIRAHSISGSISAKDIKGELALESVSGNVRLANGGKIASAKSISGNVEVTETEIDGGLSATSASGNILLRRVKARQLEAGSISGSVVLDDVDCLRVEAQSVSGDVKFGGPLGRSGRYELTSHSGNVHFAVAGGAGFEIEATTFSGNVRSDIAVDQSADPRGGRRERSIRGVVGDGSAFLDLTSFSGNVVITKR